MVSKIALGPTSKRESFKLTLRHAQRSEIKLSVFAQVIGHEVTCLNTDSDIYPRRGTQVGPG